MIDAIIIYFQAPITAQEIILLLTGAAAMLLRQP